MPPFLKGKTDILYCLPLCSYSEIPEKNQLKGREGILTRGLRSFSYDCCFGPAVVQYLVAGGCYTESLLASDGWEVRG